MTSQLTKTAHYVARLEPKSAQELRNLEDTAEYLFGGHELDAEQVARDKVITEAFKQLFKVIVRNVPPGPSRETAIRRLFDAKGDCATSIVFRGQF